MSVVTPVVVPSAMKVSDTSWYSPRIRVSNRSYSIQTRSPEMNTCPSHSEASSGKRPQLSWTISVAVKA